jgi:hypothetical protein
VHPAQESGRVNEEGCTRSPTTEDAKRHGPVITLDQAQLAGWERAEKMRAGHVKAFT